MRKLLVLVIIVVFIVAACPCWGGIPHLINYQGMLTNDEGIPLSGDFDLTFRIFDDSTGGAQKWGETQHGIMVTDGLFSVNLGDSTAIDLPFDEDYWLEIEVGVYGPLSPRSRIVSVGYAYRAERVDTSAYSFQAQRADTADYAISADTAAYALAGGEGDNDWTFRITDTADTTLVTGGPWGISRSGNVLYGSADSTHVNLGVACTTGTSEVKYRYCTVGGGSENAASKYASTVGGGNRNTASGSEATVGGGYRNSASGSYATLGGGFENSASEYGATVGGGEYNTASQEDATVGGGGGNTASGYGATVGGGGDNTASGPAATVGGGSANTASGTEATVGGGVTNTASGEHATVGGGWINTASGDDATVGGGAWNSASGYFSTVGGGAQDTASGINATVGGGVNNIASGWFSTVPGGYYNSATGYGSFAAGFWAKAYHSGCFVWGDSTMAYFTSTGSNQFLIRASGGVGIGTPSPTGQLDVNGNDIRIRTSQTPASSSADGYTGEIAWDANYIYICFSGDGPGGSADSWKRAALSTW